MNQTTSATVRSLPVAPSRRPLPATTNRLATLKRSPEWKQLTRQDQRGREAFEHRALALLETAESLDDHLDDERQEEIAAVFASVRDWTAALEELAALLSEEEREALITTKSNDLAAILTVHQAARDALVQLGNDRIRDILIRPEHEWVQPTPGDVIEDFITFGEAELARRGLPPLSFKEAFLNTITFGAVADKKVRDAERARLTSSARADVLEEGVIDVDFTTQ